MDTKTLYINVHCSKYEFFNNDIYNKKKYGIPMRL